MSSYAEECRLRAQMLLDAADGVEFQENFEGHWQDISMPRFTQPSDLYRRKPKKVRHERVVIWAKYPCGTVGLFTYFDSKDAEKLKRDGFQELKRETVFVEVEE